MPSIRHPQHYPREYYEIGADTFNHLKNLEGMMDYLVGSQDLSSLAKVQQIPAADSIERMRPFSTLKSSWRQSVRGK